MGERRYNLEGKMLHNLEEAYKGIDAGVDILETRLVKESLKTRREKARKRRPWTENIFCISLAGCLTRDVG